MSACESVTPPRSGGMYSLCLLPQTQLVTSYRQFVWMPKNATATLTVTDTGIWYSYSGNTIFALDFGVFKPVRVLLCRVFSHFFSCLFWMLCFSRPSKVYIWGLCRNLEYKGVQTLHFAVGSWNSQKGDWSTVCVRSDWDDANIRPIPVHRRLGPWKDPMNRPSTLSLSPLHNPRHNVIINIIVFLTSGGGSFTCTMANNVSCDISLLAIFHLLCLAGSSFLSWQKKLVITLLFLV